MSEPVLSLRPHERIIYAVDTNDLGRAIELVDDLKGHVGAFKFGLEFGTNLLVSLLRGRDKQVAHDQLDRARDLFDRLAGCVMWDWKFKDIPNTMRGAAAGLAAMSPELFTVHASSGVKGMRAAVDKRGTSNVLAVTALTSLDEEECIASYGTGSWETVFRFVDLACKAGVQGIVCAPRDAEFFLKPHRHEVFVNMEFVCPGIRPAWAATGDQSTERIMTPGEAAKVGISRMVIGRPITNFPEKFNYPHEAADLIAEEIAMALGQTSL